jgi:hypothetical protein
MVVLLVFVDGDLLLEFVGQHVEETVADLGLRNERGDVVDFELCTGEFVVHLLHALLQLLGHLLALLQTVDLLLVLVQYLDVLLQF